MREEEDMRHPTRKTSQRATTMRSRSNRLSSALLLGALLIPSISSAQEKPFQLSFIGPTMQLVDDDADIKGVRINLIYGVNENVTGLDVGLVNRTSDSFKGLQWGFLGVSHGRFTGWQNNWAGNVAESEFYGLQTGLVNIVGTGEGVQFGGFSHAEYMSGLQFSLVNFAEDFYGVQIGLINIIRSKDEFPILPFVNWKFDN
jgi:hypothetical protein